MTSRGFLDFLYFPEHMLFLSCLVFQNLGIPVMEPNYHDSQYFLGRYILKSTNTTNIFQTIRTYFLPSWPPNFGPVSEMDSLLPPCS